MDQEQRLLDELIRMLNVQEAILPYLSRLCLRQYNDERNRKALEQAQSNQGNQCQA